jgi:cell division protease FtsH
MKAFFKNFAIFIAIFLVLAILFSLSSAGKPSVEKIGLQKMVAQINNGEVSAIEVDKNNLNIKLTNGNQEQATKEPADSLSTLLKNFSVAEDKLAKVDINVKDESSSDIWLTVVLPLALPVLLIGAFIYFMMRSVQGANNKAMMFGQTTAKDATKEGKVKTKFADVAGAKEAKEELEEVVEFLREPKKFTDLGAKIPRGVLLLGKPGVGKTLLARAAAGEANVPFFSISGSEFVEMFVGVGASRVRDLFKKAKKNAPCIVFIDEIDAVGRRRGAGMGGSHDEREQTLNQILVEMDGFEVNAGIIVMAATNRPDVLDPALLRPGRFDRQIVIDIPDIADREAILQIHAKDKPLAEDANLRRIAERTPGFSGADLANVLNEGAILAARQNAKTIGQNDLYDAIEKVMLGPEKKSRIITDKEKKITAYHEAGHAIVANFLPNTDPVHKVSIIARGQAGGYTLKMPIEDRHMHTKEEFVEEIAVLLGGYLAEKAIFGEVTTGATADLRQATQVARLLITDFGMSDSLGPRTFGEREELIFLGREIHEQRDYSEKTAEKIDAEMSKFIEQGMVLANKVLKDKREQLEKVAQVLLEKETIERDEFDALLKEADVTAVA